MQVNLQENKQNHIETISEQEAEMKRESEKFARQK